MNDFLTVLANSLPVLSAIVAGVFAKKRNWLNGDAAFVIASLAFKISVPFLIITVLKGVTLNKSNIDLLIITILLFILLILYGVIIGKAFSLNIKSLAVISLSFAGFAVGSFAYALVEANFGKEAFANTVLVDLTLATLMMTFGYVIALFFGKKKGSSITGILKKMFSNPIILSIIFILAVNYSKVELPKEFWNTASFFGSSFFFLAAFLVGLKLEIPSIKTAAPIFGTFLARYFLVLITAFILATLFALSEIEAKALYLTVATPVSTFPLIYSEDQGFNAKFAAQISVGSFIIAMIFYPILITILK